MSEEENIKERYSRRMAGEKYSLEGRYGSYNSSLVREREQEYEEIIKRNFADLKTLSILEIGAGTGSNLGFFHRIGVDWSNIFANELLRDRLNELKKNYPHIHILPGNALEINESQKKFDVVFQSTVFTSILDNEFKRLLAGKMWNLTREGGMILWYDFKFNNPGNKDVKGVGKKEIRSLFNQATKIDFHSVTLAPPVGRRIGRLYPVINNVFPFLRSHIIAVIHK